MAQRCGLTSTVGTGPLPRVRERYEISGGQYGGYRPLAGSRDMQGKVPAVGNSPPRLQYRGRTQCNGLHAHVNHTVILPFVRSKPPAGTDAKIWTFIAVKFMIVKLTL